MPTSRKSPQRRTPYTAEEKREILARAAGFLVQGHSEYAVAKVVGVHPRTLKKWRREKRAGFEQIRVEIDARNAIREIGNLREELWSQQDRVNRFELMSVTGLVMGAIAVLFSIFL